MQRACQPLEGGFPFPARNCPRMKTKSPAARRQPRPAAKRRAAKKPTVPPAKVPAKYLPHFRKLCRMREALSKGARTLLLETRGPVHTEGSHIAEAAADQFDRDRNLGLLALEGATLAEVEAALQRLKKGTYGKCETTGKSIPLARLRAIPYTRYTAEAETARETAARRRR
jgi:DnaK suppressor protein